MAHGYFHRDIVKPDGTIAEKQAIPFKDLADGLTLALNELHRQWLFYRKQFEDWIK